MWEELRQLQRPLSAEQWDQWGRAYQGNQTSQVNRIITSHPHVKAMIQIPGEKPPSYQQTFQNTIGRHAQPHGE